MKTRRSFMIAGTACIAAAFVCFTLMDIVPDLSIAQDMLSYAGYALVTLSLYLLFRGFQLPE